MDYYDKVILSMYVIRAFPHSADDRLALLNTISHI